REAVGPQWGGRSVEEEVVPFDRGPDETGQRDHPNRRGSRNCGWWGHGVSVSRRWFGRRRSGKQFYPLTLPFLEWSIQRMWTMPRRSATFTAAVRSLTLSLAKIFFRWTWTVSSLMPRVAAISLLRLPSDTS